MSNRDSGKAFRIDRLHHAACIERATENFETAFAKNFSEIDKLHFKAAVRFIAAVSANCLAISKPIERRFDLDIARGLEDRRQHSFGNLENVVGRDERRFDIDLGKLRLPVGAQIFVTETFGNLKIFLHAGDHQQLFVLLWRLWQRVKLSGHEPAGHQKIACAFRSTLGKNWCFHFHKPLAVKKIARRVRNPVTQAQITRETRPPEIEIPLGHSQIFILRLSINREGQIICAVKDRQLARNDFDFACGKVGVFRTRRPCSDSTRNLHYIFTAQRMRLLCQSRIFLRPKNNLGQPFAIAQVNENDAAVVARDIHPAGKHDLLADVPFAKRIAVVRAIHAMPESSVSF